MATGDILSGSINADGWTIDLTIEGQGVGGIYDPGLGLNNDPTNAKVKINYTEPGYSDLGVLTTITRQCICTGSLRKPYPDQLSNQEVISGSNVILTCKLSKFIGVGATLLTSDILSGFYTDTVPNNPNSGLVITNNSTAEYGKVVGNWSCLGHNLITDSAELKADVFHRLGGARLPVRAVKFSITDTSLNTISKIITVPTPSIESKTNICVIEYVANFNSTELSVLTAGQDLSCDFEVFPIIGNATSKLNTADGVHTNLDWRYKTITNYYDPLSAYERTYAIVDPIGGSDTTGLANADFATADTTRFATIAYAIRRIRDYNNTTYGRGNCGNGIVSLVAGTHEFCGSQIYTPSDGLEKTWLEILPYPGESKSTVFGVESSVRDDSQLGSKYVKISDISFTRATQTWWLFERAVGNAKLLISNCSLDTTGVDYFLWQRNFDYIALEGSDFKINASSGISASFLRNCNITGPGAHGYLTNTIGCTFVCGVADTANAVTDSVDPLNTCDGGILAFNKFLDQKEGILLIRYSQIDHGIAIIQNVFERSAQGALSPPAVIIHALTVAGGAGANNVIRWHNTVAGQRENMAYNSVGSVPIVFNNWSEIGNISLYRAYKTDTYSVPNGNRTGNWPVGFQVDGKGNLMESSSYNVEFAGINSILKTPVEFGYIDDASTTGTSLGSGDYRLKSNSDALGLMVGGSSPLPYDLDGNPRIDNGASGAYEFIASGLIILRRRIMELNNG